MSQQRKRLPSRADLVALCGDKFEFSDLLQTYSQQLRIQGWRGKLFFDLRGEATPSVQVNAGWWYDHGVAERGDLIDLIAKARGLNLSDLDQFKEASKEAEIMLTGGSSAAEYASSGIVREIKEREYLPPMDRSEVAEWYKNKQIRKKKFESLVDGLMRSSTQAEKNLAITRGHFGLAVEDRESKKGEKYTDTRVVIPYIDRHGQVFSFGAYRRESAVKILKRQNGRPSLAGEHLVKGYAKNIPVLWTEGDGDYATALGLGINVVTCGSASMSISSFLPALAGMKVYFTPDNDAAGASALARWKVDVAEYNATASKEDQIDAHFFWWSSISWPKAREAAIEKLRALLSREGRVSETISEDDLQKRFSINLDETEIIDTRGVLKKGYDFVDFAADRGEVFQSFVSFFTKNPA